MFYYLHGIVTHCEANLAVLDVSGVGYACYTTQATLARVNLGEKAKLYTYLHIREGIQDLYGFYSLEEKNCFLQLLNISGVGPKSALSLLSVATPEQLALAVMSEDDKTFTQASGVGKKLAQRIILELKDSVAKRNALSSPVDISVGPIGIDPKRDAQAALMVLGYSASEAYSVVSGLDASLSVEEMIKQALKGMMKP